MPDPIEPLPYEPPKPGGRVVPPAVGSYVAFFLCFIPAHMAAGFGSVLVAYFSRGSAVATACAAVFLFPMDVLAMLPGPRLPDRFTDGFFWPLYLNSSLCAAALPGLYALWKLARARRR